MLKYPGYEDYIFEPYTLTGHNITLHADMVPLPVTTPSGNQSGYRSSATRYNPPRIRQQPRSPPRDRLQTQGKQAQVIGSSGSLSVTTTPYGAEIFIDNEMKGVSPAIISGLSRPGPIHSGS